MIGLDIAIIFLPVVVVGYAYFIYPALLWAAVRLGRPRPVPAPPAEWPMISITVPAYNEERAIAATLDRLLELDYPADRRQILVVSDASSDRTDDIVRGYADRGVELLRMPTRGGKTAAENAARPLLRGDIVVNTDASVRIARDAVKPLVVQFGDPSVGVASGRDVSVARVDETANLGESGYVGYEMWIRDLESRVSGIIGASGCFYAIRVDLHRSLVPEALSRDFAAAIIAREQGYRALSVNEALCYVPRTSNLHNEYRRKVRTMARGMETLFYKRHMLNPFRYPLFSWMLISHKLVRWAAPWSMAMGATALLILALVEPWARWPAAAVLVGLGLALLGWNWPESRPMPRLVAVPTYALTGSLAAIHASLKALRGELNPIWEPTRRASVDQA
jgi:cellulose synthase/poly-beta-1,6-N-acetylglucosamine synthase-like glycosyltransferase